MSPIAAIRHSDNIKIKSKKLKTPAYIHKMFGEGGIIVYSDTTCAFLTDKVL